MAKGRPMAALTRSLIIGLARFQSNSATTATRAAMATPITAKPRSLLFLCVSWLLSLASRRWRAVAAPVPRSVPYRVARPAGRVKRRPGECVWIFPAWHASRARRNRRSSPAGAAALAAAPDSGDGACRKAHGARSYKRQDYATDGPVPRGTDGRTTWRPDAAFNLDFRGSGVRAADFQPPGPGRVAMAARAQCRRTAAADAGRPAHRRAPDRRHGGLPAVLSPWFGHFSFAADAAAV